MTEDCLINSGQAEAFKAFIHLAVFGLSVMCLGYSAMAYGQRRERHLLTNVAVYSGLTTFEVVQLMRHWSAR